MPIVFLSSSAVRFSWTSVAGARNVLECSPQTLQKGQTGLRPRYQKKYICLKDTISLAIYQLE